MVLLCVYVMADDVKIFLCFYLSSSYLLSEMSVHVFCPFPNCIDFIYLFVYVLLFSIESC